MPYLESPKTPARALLGATLLCFLAAGAASGADGPMITEFLTDNENVLRDEDGDSRDWIEIYNPSPAPIDLAGYHLTDDAEEPERWTFPEVTLASGGHLIVWASGKDRASAGAPLHTNFRLSNSGGYLALLEPGGETILSEYTYEQQFEDISYGLAQTGDRTTITLIPERAACRWLVPTSDIGNGWIERDFDDGSWTAGQTAVGYEASNGYQSLIGPGGDVRSVMEDVTPSVYIRVPFTVEDTADLIALNFRMRSDDGFVAYLNGVRVASDRAPATLNFASGASADHTDSSAINPQFFELGLFLEELVEGENVLAIHGLNNGSGSSDLLMYPELDADRLSEAEIGDPGYFRSPTPGVPNGTDQGLPSSRVSFSPAGRTFSGSLQVTLSAADPGADIHYTTDGSLPGLVSPRYTGPINLNSSTLLRAVAVEPGKTAGAVVDHGYIQLASSVASFTSDLPIVIMERFGGGPSKSNGKSFIYWAVLEPGPITGRTSLNGSFTMGTRGGFEVRGSSSAGFAKQSWAMEAWGEGVESVDVGPLGMPPESDWILSGRYQFDLALMRNPFIYELSNQTGPYAVRTRFVEVYKNENGGALASGDYWGVYTFMERIDRDPGRVDVERLSADVTTEPGITGGYIMKIDRGSVAFGAGGSNLVWVYPRTGEATAAQTNYMRTYMGNMAASLSNPNPDTGYEQFIDVDSFIDHHLLNVLSKNADALRLSTYMFKKREGRLEMGPIWDFDRSMESTDGRDNDPTGWQGGTNYFTYPWWNTLFQDDGFWQRYVDRYRELRRGVWATSNIHGIIDRMAAELDEAQVRNFQRWNPQPRFGGYQGEVNHLKNWLSTRLDWMDDQMVPMPFFSRPGGPVAAGTQITISGAPGGHDIFYSTNGSDPRADTTVTVDTTPLLAQDAPVRVLVPTGNIGTSWRGASEPFNDASWIAGTNGVGYEDSPADYDNLIRTDIGAQMDGNVTSAYVRIPFNLAAGAADDFTFLSLDIRYDDGFVAYLNGTEIARANAPGGSPAWNAGATGSHADGSAAQFQSFDVTDSLGALRTGANILAIHGVNNGLNSSDFLIQATLAGGSREVDIDGGGIPYTGPVRIDESVTLTARISDPSGGRDPATNQAPVGTGWSAATSVRYLVGETYVTSGQLAMTELMYAPPDPGRGPDGSGFGDKDQFEFIELQNVGGGRVSLYSSRFTGGVRFDFSTGDILSLDPGEYVLVVRNREAFTRLYGAAAAARVAGEFEGALNDGGENLTLLDAGGGALLAFDYDNRSPWPEEASGKGTSLVYAGGSPAGTADPANWRASRSLVGTPGAPESTAEAVPPIWINELLTRPRSDDRGFIELYNPNGEAVDIGGWLIAGDLGAPERFTIPADTSIPPGGYHVITGTFLDPSPLPGVPVDPSGGTAILLSADASGNLTGFAHEVSFAGAVEGVAFGRHVTSDGRERFPPQSSNTPGAANVAPQTGPLVFEELSYNPSGGGAAGEFVEIRNAGSSAVTLDGVRVAGMGYTYPEGANLTLAPGAVALVVATDPAAFRNAHNVPPGVPVNGPATGRLANGGERISLEVPLPGLTGPGGATAVAVADTLRYDDEAPWPVEADGGGVTLQRVATSALGDEPENWTVSEAAGGTPGTVPGVEPVDPDAWKEAFFTAAERADPAISGDGADPDRDGLSNLLEYLLGHDPTAASAAPDTTLAIAPSAGAGQHLALTFRRRRAPAAGLSLLAEVSDDLVSWRSGPGEVEIVGAPADNGDGTETLTVRDLSPVGDEPGSGRFIRLRSLRD